jgi:uncharacterized protein
MKRALDPDRLDVAAFAEAAADLSARDPLSRYERLVSEASAPPAVDATVTWQARGQQRAMPGGGANVPWLHLKAETALPMVCQRCLGPVEVPLQVDRWFRFAADEATAAIEDEDADEDVLALGHDFNLRALVEDELLMELPVAPRHEACPQPVRTSAVDDDFDAAQAARPNPFAVLGKLRRDKGE